MKNGLVYVNFGLLWSKLFEYMKMSLLNIGKRCQTNSKFRLKKKNENRLFLVNFGFCQSEGCNFVMVFWKQKRFGEYGSKLKQNNKKWFCFYFSL